MNTLSWQLHLPADLSSFIVKKFSSASSDWFQYFRWWIKVDGIYLFVSKEVFSCLKRVDSDTFWQLIAKNLVAENLICSNAANGNAWQALTSVNHHTLLPPLCLLIGKYTNHSKRHFPWWITFQTVSHLSFSIPCQPTATLANVK